MKRIIPLLLTAFFLTALLAACGTAGGTGKETTAATETTTTAAPVTTEAPKPSLAVFVDGVNGSNENDGMTPESAVADFTAAFTHLGGDYDRIVIVNTVPYTAYLNMPSADGITVIFTTSYDGVDYYETNKAKLYIGNAVNLDCDAVFENITLTARTAQPMLCLGFHNVSFDESVKTEGVSDKYFPYIVAGSRIADTALNAAYAPTAADTGFTGDCEINIYGGTWGCFCGGNYRMERNSPVSTVDGDITVNVGGSAVFKSNTPADDIVGNAFSAGGANICKGSITLNIEGGVFDMPVYGLSRMGVYFNQTAANGKTGTDGLQFGKDVRYECDIEINISGGDFSECERISALEWAGNTPLHGSYSLNITGGSFSEKTELDALGVLGDSAVTGVSDSLLGNVHSFDVVNKTVTGEGKALRIAFAGDSITWGTAAKATAVAGYSYGYENYSYTAQLQKLYGYDAVIGNFGYPGSNLSASSYASFYKSLSYGLSLEFDPDIIVIALGTNNAASSGTQSSLNSFISTYKQMLAAYHKAFPEARIIITTALYRFDNTDRINQLNTYILPAQKQIQADTAEYTELLDLFTLFRPYGSTTYYADKLHPNNLGYEKLAKVIYDALASLTSLTAEKTEG